MNNMKPITEELIEERSKCRNFSIFKKRNLTLVNILLNDSCFSNHNNIKEQIKEFQYKRNSNEQYFR